MHCAKKNEETIIVAHIIELHLKFNFLVSLNWILSDLTFLKLKKKAWEKKSMRSSKIFG